MSRSLPLSRALFSVLLLIGSIVAASPAAIAQVPDPQATSKPAVQTPSTDTANDDEPRRFFDEVTVSATLNPVVVKETPGTVSVIDAGTIERQLVENMADLIRFEPGIYIESSITRIGLNGFNIRGIGGNRVMTQIDGVETSEQFDFGPFNVHQFTLDLDTLKSAEIVRSAGSSLYGSDALGGVVSLFTKDPADYLAGQRFHFGAKTLYDSRADDASGNVVIAGGSSRVQSSLFVSYTSGHEPDNHGDVESDDATRTALNPQDRRGVQALGKIAMPFADGSLFRASAEIADNEIETQAFSSRAITVQGPVVTNVADITSDDTLRRRRVSIDHTLVNRLGLNQWAWNLYAQQSDSGQVVDERRITTGAGISQTVNRSGTLDYEQQSFGGAIQGRKAVTPGGRPLLFTFGGSYKHNAFDMIRDRTDIDAVSGAVIPAANLILPSKYFPKSDVSETGLYLQGEMRFGRVTLVPAVRHDRFSLDADASDPVFIASLSPAAADFEADATSAKLGAAVQVSNAVTLHAQYAGGFRAPPYSAVNSGFTNLQGGYTSIPNTALDAETSDNVELGARASVGPLSLGVTGFWNSYENFILQVQRGLNPATRLLEFQYQNVSQVKIRGVEIQSDARLADTLRLRFAYALINGDDVSGPTDIPLNTIAPDQATIGLQYTSTSNRWGSDFIVRVVAAQSQETAGAGLFAPEAYGVADAMGWIRFGHRVALRAGILNLTNVKYFEWTNVRGRQATDPVIDRYSSAGTSGIVSLSYGW